jgi:effector-binding domain-containing protein
VAVVCGTVSVAEIPAFLASAFREVVEVLAELGNAPTGPPFARYQQSDDGFDTDAGFPCRTPVTPSKRVQPAVLPETRAAKVLHVGAYGDVGHAYAAIEKWMVENGYVSAGAPWECYLDGPEVAAPRTLVFYPCTPA